MIVLLIGGGVLRGVGDGRTPMLVTAFANVLNAGLAYMLIYGHFGMPALGAAGSAWATFLSRLVGAALLVGVLVRGRNGVRIGGHGGWRPQWNVARQVLRIGLPAALEEVILITAFATLTPLVATAGTIALAAHRVAMNVLSLSFLPGIGLALAATALVGQSVGARRPEEAREIAAIALRWAVIWMSVFGLIFLVSAPLLMRLFSDDPRMITSGAGAIRVVALAQPLWAMSLVYAGALRGTGNTRLPLLISTVITWSAVGIAYLLVTLVQPSLAAVWLPIALLSPFEVACFWWAWRRWNSGPTSLVPNMIANSY
jgi:putative MATE family efflux protein